MKAKANTEAGVCPLCQSSNRCAQVDPEANSPCWCLQEIFPSHLVEGQAAQMNDRCICQHCLKQAQESDHEG